MLRTLLAVLLVLLPTIVCAAPLARHNRLEQSVAVRPLDDSANPFREQYADWDRWLYEHYIAVGPDDPPPMEDRFAEQYALEGYVDEHGWLLPQVEVQRLTAAWYRDGSINPLRDVYPFRFHSAGAMDEDTLRAARAAFARARAPYYPPVPQWLVERQPEWSFVLPDGRVVTTIVGRGGTWPGLFDWSAPDVNVYGWQLLSPAGEELGATLPQSWWWELTIPDFRQRIEPFRKPLLNVVEKYGHIHVYDMDSGLTYANYDWDGTPLQANLKLHAGRDGCPFLGISGFDLPAIYAEQQRLASQIESAP